MPPPASLIPKVRLPILTPRLSLELPSLRRAKEYPPLIGEMTVARWLLRVPHPYRRSDALQFIRGTARRHRLGANLSLSIADRESTSLMGGIGLHGLDWEHRHGELGYWLGQPYWGKGYGSEAVDAILTVAFGTLRLHRVEAGVFPGNKRSERVLLKAGFVREGLRREAFFKWGRWTDDTLFGLTVQDWRKARSKASRARK